MVYSLFGGKGYAAENVAVDGWSSWKWETQRCDSFLVDCQLPQPQESIRELERLMVYDDARSNWGHRDNILKPNHELVNIGLAWNDRFVVLVQQFEKISVSVIVPPAIIDGTLSLSFEMLEPRLKIGNLISVYYDPPIVSRAPRELSETGPRSYCYGGGYTSQCPDEFIRILRPLEPGQYYPVLESNETVATTWRKIGSLYEIRAQISRFTRDPGILTVVLWDEELKNILFTRSV